MLKKIALISALIFTLSACSITDIPSFYDDNESAGVIDVVFAVKDLNCESHFAKNQVEKVYREYLWLEILVQLKGSDDIGELLQPFERTLIGLYDKRDKMTVKYCELKRTSLLKQSEMVAIAILGRY